MTTLSGLLGPDWQSRLRPWETAAPGEVEAVSGGVALSMADPVALVRSLVALDGRVPRILLLSPGLAPEVTADLMAEAGVATLATREVQSLDAPQPTEWVLTTSGTTGRPKLARHRLQDLIRTVRPKPAIWGLLYDPSRFAGLQVVLQALIGDGWLALTDPAAPLAGRVRQLARAGCTHLSATPSLWRQLLMLPALPVLSQVTLGGEIADAALLDALAARFPGARVTQIYASTELGVGFSVQDGLPGFPAEWLGDPTRGIEIRSDIMWLRRGAEFVSTGDRVERRGGRVRFLGREQSTINVGGTKLNPEDIEEVLSQHPAVAHAQVRAKPSPLVGALVVAEIVPRDLSCDSMGLKRDLAAWCRDRLPPEARPAHLSVVPALVLTAAGKVPRA